MESRVCRGKEGMSRLGAVCVQVGLEAEIG